MVPLHGSGIPHVDTFGLSPWVQWSVIGIILLVGCWLMLDVRGRSATSHRPVDGELGEDDGPLVAAKRGAEASASSSEVGGPLTDLLTFPVPLPPAAARGREAAGRARSTMLGQKQALPSWLNPIRMLAAVLGIGAGVQAMDRVREIMELDAMLGMLGTQQVSRGALWLTVLLCVGGALAMPAPKLAAVAFLGAGALAAFFAMTSWWESKLGWWGAEYALTAWSNLWVWAAVGLALTGLALAGEWYRPRGTGSD